MPSDSEETDIAAPQLPIATIQLQRVTLPTDLEQPSASQEGSQDAPNLISMQSSPDGGQPATSPLSGTIPVISSSNSTVTEVYSPPHTPTTQHRNFNSSIDASPTSTKQITANIIADLKEAFRLKTTKKSGDLPKANLLFKDATDLLTSLPQIFHIEQQSQIQSLHNRLAEKNQQIKELNTQLESNNETIRTQQIEIANLLDQGPIPDGTDSTLSKSFLTHIMQEVDSKLISNFSRIEEKITTYLDDKLSRISCQTASSPPTANPHVATPTPAKGALVLAPPNPVPINDAPNYLAALKNKLAKANVDSSTITATQDTRTGSLVIKCKQDQDLKRLQHTLSQNREIKKMAKITRLGPKRTKLLVKNIPYDLDERTLTNSLNIAFKTSYTRGRYFTYKNSRAFSQVIEVEEDAARLLLSRPSPTIQIGPCYYPVSIFVPILRCFKCQAFGHHHSKCLQEKSYCAICGRSGHTSETCNSSAAPACINCHTFNNRTEDHHSHLDTHHEAFSKKCSVFKEYFARTYDNLFTSLIPQLPQHQHA